MADDIRVAPSSEPSIPAESGITGYCIDNYHECCDVPCGCHCHKIKALEDRIAELEGELQSIHNWCEAYPLEVFPKPDLKRARELLGDAEFTRLNAHSMRHVVEGFKARAALAAPSGVKP